MSTSQAEQITKFMNVGEQWATKTFYLLNDLIVVPEFAVHVFVPEISHIYQEQVLLKQKDPFSNIRKECVGNICRNVCNREPLPELIMARNKKSPLSIKMILVTENMDIWVFSGKLHCFILLWKGCPYFFPGEPTVDIIESQFVKHQRGQCYNMKSHERKRSTSNLIYASQQDQCVSHAVIVINLMAFLEAHHVVSHKKQPERSAF